MASPPAEQFLAPPLDAAQTIACLQVHFPFPTFPQGVLADALTEAMERGLVKAVGVCNYDAKQLTQLNDILSKRGIPIASNQVGAALSDLICPCPESAFPVQIHALGGMRLW